jgi:hypothetical protein
MRLLGKLDAGAPGGPKAGPPFGLLDDTLPSDAAGYWNRQRALFDDEAACVAAIRARPEHAADAAGRLLLQQLAGADQPLIDLVARIRQQEDS